METDEEDGVWVWMCRLQIGETALFTCCPKSMRQEGTRLWLLMRSRVRRAKTRCAVIPPYSSIFHLTPRLHSTLGRRVLLPRHARAPRRPPADGRVLSPEVGFPLVGPSPSQVLTAFLPLPSSIVCPFRAQIRVAQQRIDSKLPLKRIIDMRKKVFAEVKVCIPLTNVYLRAH